jgi:hypothetical protein
MIAPTRFASNASSRSTDLTANDVDRFMARGIAMTSRPPSNECRCSTGAPASLEELHPSLHVVRIPAIRPRGRGLRALAAGVLSRFSVLEPT